MDIFLIIATFQAILLAILLLVKQKKSVSDYILSAYFTLNAISILLVYLEIRNRKSGYPFPWLISLSVPIILLVGPNLWLYVKSLTAQHFKLKPVYLFLLIPFFLVLLLLAARLYLQPNEQKIIYEQTEAFRNDFMFFFIVGLIALSNIGYTLWSLLLIKRYRRALKTYFSRTESIDLAWLRFLLISALLGYATISGMYILDTAINLMTYQTLQLVSYVVASVLVLLLGFFGLKQGNIFSSISISFDMEKGLIVPEPMASIDNKEQVFIKKLLAHMQEAKPHQNAELTLASLSSELKVQPEYLSGIINGRLNMNFFDFINHYRVEDFKAFCKDIKNKNITIISLAYDCGFNSKATFNRVFKKTTGKRPSDYAKQFM